MVRANKFHQTCRGIGDGMQAKWTIRNTGSPSGDRGMDQLAARERQAGLTGMAERLVVLTKPEGGRKKRRQKGRLAMSLITPKLFSEVADSVGSGVFALRRSILFS
jgi:hypothetical protein